jgi:GT2 family glycosyltransferase
VTCVDQHGEVDCAIVIVTYNSAYDIDRLLDSLSPSAIGLTTRIVVVDNGSVDETVKLVQNRPDVLCVETGANLGYAGGINVGRLHASEYRSICVLNPDLVLQPGALSEMYAALKDPDVGAVVPALLDSAGDRYPSLRREPTVVRALGDALLGARIIHRSGWLSEIVYRDRDYEIRHSTDWATGAAMLVSAACDQAVGPWDESFFLYSEEVDYARRIRAAGFRMDYVPAAQARHRGAGSGQSAELYALLAVNRIRYAEKHGRHPVAYRAAVILHELLRSADPVHRSALRLVIRRSSWPRLFTKLNAPLGDTCNRVPQVKV